VSEILSLEQFDLLMQKKIEYIEKYINIIKNDEINPMMINHALASHTGIMSFLIREYEKKIFEYEQSQEEFKIDFDEWYLEARDKLMSKRNSSKFPANYEIEAEARVSFYRRLMESWESQGYKLGTLSANARSEMKSLFVEDYANAEPRPKKVAKR
jgi:hypothetical protein